MWNFYLIQVWKCGLKHAICQGPSLKMFLLHVTIRTSWSFGCPQIQTGQSMELSQFLPSDVLKELGWDSGELSIQALSLPQTVLQAGAQVFPSLAQAWSVLTLDVDGD